MTNLDTRLSTLEKATGMNGPDTIIISFMARKGEEKELTALKDHRGTTWTRTPDESEDQFIDRAKAEVVRNKGGIAMLFAGN